MSVERVKKHLQKWGADTRILTFAESSATVELAARAAGCEPARIAKTLSFQAGERTILIVAAGDARIDNRKYKDLFHTKAMMLRHDDVPEKIGHEVGGVCPLGVNEGVEIFLDKSLQRFETVFPAAGAGNNAIEVTLGELETFSGSDRWIDVCKIPEPENPEP